MSVLSVVIHIFLAATAAASEKLSEPAIYSRCYAQFVRALPKDSDPLLEKIKKGQMSAASACVALLEAVQIDPASPGAENSTPLEILRTFQAFHSGWFRYKDYQREDSNSPTADLYDSNEMGFHVTYSLFSPQEKFSSIVTRPFSFRAVRTLGNAADFLMFPEPNGKYRKRAEKKWEIGRLAADASEWKPNFIEFGKLLGIKPAPAKASEVSFESASGRKLAANPAGTSYGAGILGTVPYLLLNTNQNVNTPSNFFKMHRVWAASIFSDLFCRSMPVIREADATPFVYKSKSLPWKGNVKCMQCHATMDPMASNIRNILELFPAGGRKEAHSPRMLAKTETDLPKQAFDGELSLDFSRQAPEGRLYFRNYKGTLISERTSNLSDLGRAISEQDDLYICAAQRYFEFLTGIKVNIGDFSQAPLAHPTAKTDRYRQFVINQGLLLKKHQHLSKLIYNILSSNFYALDDYGVSQ